MRFIFEHALAAMRAGVAAMALQGTVRVASEGVSRWREDAWVDDERDGEAGDRHDRLARLEAEVAGIRVELDENLGLLRRALRQVGGAVEASNGSLRGRPGSP